MEKQKSVAIQVHMKDKPWKRTDSSKYRMKPKTNHKAMTGRVSQEKINMQLKRQQFRRKNAGDSYEF